MDVPSVILCPTDGSPCAQRALALAEDLAVRCGADLHVLRVELVGAADLKLSGRASLPEAGRASGPPRSTPAPVGRQTFEVVRLATEAGHAILDYARDVRAGLILMGTRGRHGLDRLMLGSVAEHVLRRAGCPVLLVPEGGRATLDGGRLLVPYDFSAPADRALMLARDLALKAGTGLDVLHIIEDLHIPSVYGRIDVPALDYEALAHRAEAGLQERVEALADGAVPVDTRVTRGDPVQGTLAFARARNADLIVMGSHGRKGVDRVLLGSVAEGVVRRAPCPVLVVKEPREAEATPPVAETDEDASPELQSVTASS